MKTQDYEVRIPEGTETIDGYVALSHATHYTIKLTNHGSRKADVEVFIDGGRVGEWRINPASAAVIERPVHDAGRFTFYRLGTEESKASELKPSSELGLVRVIFKPEKDTRDFLLGAPPDLEAGGTGLSGRSKQAFGSVTSLETDRAEHVTIHLRLGVTPSDARPLFPASSPVPPSLSSKKTATLDKTEIYLYGTLFALVKEQLDAIEQQAAGKLGFWGKGRFRSRAKVIGKFAVKILQHKRCGQVEAVAKMACDLDCIETDNGLWKDMTTEQLEYLRNFLRAF